jgi:hypothetical protein
MQVSGFHEVWLAVLKQKYSYWKKRFRLCLILLFDVGSFESNNSEYYWCCKTGCEIVPAAFHLRLPSSIHSLLGYAWHPKAMKRAGLRISSIATAFIARHAKKVATEAAKKRLRREKKSTQFQYKSQTADNPETAEMDQK